MSDNKIIKVLLIYTNNETFPFPAMPIGLCYVAGALENEGYEVQVLDLMFKKDRAGAVQKKIAKFKPDLIGLSIRNIDSCSWKMSTFYIDQIKTDIVDPIRKATRVPIVIGGAAVNIMPENIKSLLDVDYYLTGDGEKSIIEFLHNYNSGNTEKSDYTPSNIPDLSKIETPQIYKWINLKPYINAGTPYPIQTKRGCAFNCIYCVYPNLEGRLYRKHDPKKIVNEIEQAIKAGYWHFEIVDSIFNSPLDHAIAILQEIVNRKLNISLTSTGISTRFFTRELLALMEQAGFSDFSFTPDTGADQLIKNFGKGYTDKTPMIDAAQKVGDTKLGVKWWFTFGHPGESKETIDETLDFIKNHVRPLDIVHASIGIRIFPDTPLYTTALNEKKLDEADDLLRPVYYAPDSISLEEITTYLSEKTKSIHNMFLNTDKVSPIYYVAKFITSHIHLREPLWRPRVRHYYRMKCRKDKHKHKVK